MNYNFQAIYKLNVKSSIILPCITTCIYTWQYMRILISCHIVFYKASFGIYKTLYIPIVKLYNTVLKKSSAKLTLNNKTLLVKLYTI